MRAFIDNDANLGALAEQTYGTREHAETVVYVKASTGVGAGIIVHNSVLRGHGGMAGNWVTSPWTRTVRSASAVDAAVSRR